MPGEMADVDVLPPEQAGEGEPDNRAGAVPDTTVTILEAIRSGSSEPQQQMMSILGDQDAGRPELGMLFKFLSDNQVNGNDALRDQIREELREEQGEAFAELGAATEKLIEENVAVRGRLEVLAAAIGACPTCFGEDLLCDTCHGAGSPGSRMPQADEFNHYVRPALERVQEALRRPRARRPWPR